MDDAVSSIAVTSVKLTKKEPALGRVWNPHDADRLREVKSGTLGPDVNVNHQSTLLTTSLKYACYACFGDNSCANQTKPGFEFQGRSHSPRSEGVPNELGLSNRVHVDQKIVDRILILAHN